MEGEVFGFEEATAKQILRQLNRPSSGTAIRTAPFSNPFTGLRIAYVTAAATARSGSACGSGTATLYTIDPSGGLATTGNSVTFYNFTNNAIASDQYVALGALGQTWVILEDDSATSDTLERFVMTSNWVGGLASATFTNLSEPGWPTEYGIVEDPLGIFVDILGVGGEGLSIRTRYGRHYVIQAKCDQVEVPPVDPVGACSIYTEANGLQCFQTTEAVCDSLGGTYGGDGISC